MTFNATNDVSKSSKENVEEQTFDTNTDIDTLNRILNEHKNQYMSLKKKCDSLLDDCKKNGIKLDF